MAFNIRGVIALDGEAELKKAVTNINSSLREMKSELAYTEEKFKDQANTMEALQKKYGTLSSAVEQAKEKEKALSEIIESAKNKQKTAADTLDKLTKEYEEAKKKLDELKSSNASTTEEISEQEKTVKDLSSQLGSAKKSYLDAETSVNKWNTSLNKAQTETAQLEDELNQTSQYLNEAKSSADGCATSIDKFGNEVKDAGSEAKDAGSEVASMGDKLKTAFTNKIVSEGVDLIKDGLQELAEVAKEVVEVGSEFEAAMSEVAAISGATGDDLDALTEKAKELGETTKYSASEAAEAFQYMSLAGWSTEEMLEGIDGVMTLAAASGMELAEASDLVTDYLSAFGMEASDAAYMADMLAYAQSNSNTTAEQLGEAYQNCAANLNAAGQDIETVTSLLEAMANQGYKGSEAGTALAAIMRDITSAMDDGAITIGDTSVAVADAEGNYRDLTDILKDVEAATEGMGDAEKATALSTVFTSDSTKGLNLILNEGIDDVEGYEEALRNCEGAASDMADTMQDNLQGDLTKLNSALEGLGVEVYEYISGPLRSVVQGVTSIISGITDVISPEQDAIESLVSAAKEANDSVSESMANRSTSIANAELEATQIQTLADRLMELNEIEDKTAAQKAEMEQIVEQLSTSIPELAEAYDAETGSLSLTNEELQKYIDAQKESVIQQALLSANEDLINSLVEAQTQLDNVSNKISELSTQNDIYDSQIAEIEQLEQAYVDGTISQEEYQNGLMGIALQYEDLLTTGQISMNTLEADLQKLKEANTETITGLTEDQEEYQATIDEGTEIINQNAESAEKLASSLLAASDATDEAADSNEDYADSGEEATDKSDELIVSMEEVAAAATGDIGAIEDLNKTLGIESDQAEEAAESTEELESALDDAATAAEKSAEAQETAFNNIYDAYTSTFESIAEDLKNKIDLSSKFEGGDDITTETMNENLDSYIEGLQTYQENLEKVRSMVDESGNKIFSDDVLAEIEANGTDMANMLEHIVWTYENQGEYGVEQIEGINDKWQEALDMSEEIARVGAANQTAYELAMGELGSSDIDFSNLQKAIDEAVEAAGEGWSGLTEETKAALQESIDLAQSMGIQIPDGLADAIANGETSAEQAIEQLNSSIQGTLEGLLLVAQNSGADVSDELASSITAGTADAETAMSQLMAAISNSAEGDGSVASAVESEVDGAVETISEKSEELEESGSGITDSIATGITDNEEALIEAVDEVVTAGAEAAKSGDHPSEYEEAGKTLVDSLATGITDSTSTGEEAASDLSKAIAAAATEILLGNDTLAQFQNAGFEGAKAYGEGIQQGEDTAEAYATKLAQAVSDVLANEIGGFQDAAFKAVFAYNSEFSASDALSDAQAQAQVLAQAASDALNDADKSGIEAAGADVEDTYATAMATSSMQSDTRDQAKKLAAAALEGVQYNLSSFRSAGYNMASGLASGISSGRSTVITAARNTAAAALAAAKDELGIHSPSAVFREEVGQQIGTGMAFGIDDSSSLAGESAEKMSEKVYAKATAWLTEYKKTHSTTLDDEQYFWQEITKHCEEGSSAYEKALANYNTALAKSIKSSVSTTTTSGSGSNKTTVAKDTEEYYSDVFEAAQDYMDKLETISDVSLEEQLSYWKAVQTTLQEGTDAWYDAQKEINSINDSLYSTIISEAEQALSNMKVLNDISLKDEIRYWKQVRKQIVAEGGKYTDDWYEVTETIKNLRQDYYDSLIEETEDTIEKQKILGDLSVEDELKYWEKLLKKLEKKGLEYSDQWYEVYENVKDLQEEYYDDLLDTAEDELDKLETTTGVSLSEQLSYWKSYLSKFEEESEQWYSVLEKINDIQDQIGTTSAASDLLSAYETYFDLSELAEMEYWDTVRQTYEEGTDERLKADQEYLEAKEAYYDKLEELETDYADSVKEIEENLAEQVADLWDEYYDAIESRTEEIASAFGLFDEFYSESSDGKTLLYNLQTQVAGYQDWADTLKALEQRGILSEELLSELAEMGPEQSAALHALYDLTDEELTAYNEAYTQKMEIAAQQAAEENEELKATIEAQVEELQAQASEELEELKKTYEESVSTVNTTISDELYSLARNIQSIAEDQTTALVYAIQQSMSSSSSTSTSSTSSTTSSLLSSAGYASGGRNIKDELVWMDEELSSKGAELVVNRSDNALLTRLPSGSNDIIDADTTSNLFNWGSIDPDELLSVVAKQQDAAVSYLDEMGAVGTAAQLNDLMAVGTGASTTSTMDTSTMEGLLANMAGVMEQFLPYLAEKTTVSIDRTALAENIAYEVGSELTKIGRRAI